MILKNRGALDPKSMADELLRQREVLRQHHEIIRAVQERIAIYEERYSLVSAEVPEAIERGTLIESAEVCDWLIDIDLLRRARATEER